MIDNLYEVVLINGLNLVGKVVENSSDKLILEDVLKVLMTPVPNRNAGEDASFEDRMLFVTTMLPFKYISDTNKVVIDKTITPVLLCEKVSLFKYNEMYELNLERYNKLYVNDGLDSNNVSEKTVI